MGEVPIQTCMNYQSGVYRQCLLSYFDGNKKIIYTKNKKGCIVARAVMRLTKMTDAPQLSPLKDQLDFTDVTMINKSSSNGENGKEVPVIFLERCYSGVQGQARLKIEADLIRFAMKKAKDAGCGLMISNDYPKHAVQDAMNDTIKESSTWAFITKSKAGMQYLDSFGGTYSNNSDLDTGHENSYMPTVCYVAFFPENGMKEKGETE